MSDTLTRLIKVLGHDTAARFIQDFGGTRLDIPKSTHKNQRARPGALTQGLIDTLGEAKFYDLTKALGGEELYIPRGQHLVLHDRNAKIVSDYTAGTSVNHLARRYGLTYRRIEIILATHLDQAPTPFSLALTQRATTQLELFPTEPLSADCRVGNELLPTAIAPTTATTQA